MLSEYDPRVEYLGSTPNINFWPVISLSFILHMTLFYVIRVPKSMQMPDVSGKILPIVMIKSYILSTFHATISVVSVSMWCWKFDNGLKTTNRVLGGGVKGTGDEYMAYSICISLG
ncbi:unnamed protein product [Didymodactylos carnosus]|uniref:Uncharacterized protein n=1 Tax=Didymodactylos carnosus TaxID=1234261 RepID=A0A814WXV5_9BILA|nr:unnamed protein product [Didymodactylos carnosus]CAF1360440.1 unnamed protein product [Didymodactylos carnosus]CAF3972405.1 unnamed protein product [Didymodactylos carnosus]CAF4170573.1 unnamed protein product [Didymodactylos carnosus]